MHRKYVSTSVYSDYFRKCLMFYLTQLHHRAYSENQIWDIINGIRFDNGIPARNCKLFKEMKEYSVKYPMSEIGLTWAEYFINADEELIRRIILEMIDEKEKRREIRENRKSNSYSAQIDDFNNYVRQCRFKLKNKGVSDDMLESFDELQEQVKIMVYEYKNNNSPFDYSFYSFFFSTKSKARELFFKLSRNAECVGVAV